MDDRNSFYTMKGYQLFDTQKLTPAMEDYLEMICRISEHTGSGVRVRDLSSMLHVRPSSVSKMVRQLASSGYIQAERYGKVRPTEKGRETGKYLLYRHNTVYNFLVMLNGKVSALEETEKIEHFLSKETVDNLNRLTAKLSEKKQG